LVQKIVRLGLALLFSVNVASAAATKISDLTALTSPEQADEFVIVDKSDTTQAASGSTKKITLRNLIGNPTNGSILFADNGALAQDNANFFWDDTNNTLKIGNNSADYLSGSKLQSRAKGTSPVGTVSTTSGANTITGSGTTFFGDIKIGDIVEINGEYQTVSNTTSQTAATTLSNWSGSNSGVSYKVYYAGAGTVTTSSGSGTVTGSSTQFLNYSVGSKILVNGEARTISAIASNTSLTTDNWSASNSALTWYADENPLLTLTNRGQFMFGNGPSNDFYYASGRSDNSITRASVNGGTHYGLLIYDTNSITDASHPKNIIAWGLGSRAEITGTNTQNWTASTALVGFSNQTYVQSGASGTIAEILGAYYDVRNLSSLATVTDLAGSRLTWGVNSGAATNVYGHRLSNITNSGTITNTYGFHVGDITTGTQTNTPYSFYASDANAIGLYSAGKVGINQTAPTSMLDVVPTNSSTIGSIIKGAASQTANLTEWQDSSASVLAAVTAAGRLGIGTTSPLGPLHIDAAANDFVVYSTMTSVTDTLGTARGMSNRFLVTPTTNPNTTNLGVSFETDLTSAPSSSYRAINNILKIPSGNSTSYTSVVGLLNQPVQAGNGSITSLYGVLNQPLVSGAATVANIFGLYNNPEISAAATVTNVVADYAILTNNNASSTITSGYGVRTLLQNVVGTITNAYGVYVSGSGSGTFTNTYGYYVGDITTGTQTNTPFSFYASDAGTLNYFAGKTGINQTAPTSMLDVVASSASTIGNIVKAAASQTANLTEWQDSTGTVLAKVGATGFFTAPGIRSNAYNSEDNSISILAYDGGTTNSFYDGSGVVNLKLTGSTGAIFNDSGVSTMDFRMEGDTNTHLFFLDASADKVGINQSAPAAKLHVTAEATGDEVHRIETVATNDDVAEGVYQYRATTTDNTATTIATIPVPSSTTLGMHITIVARRTGGTAGTAEDGGFFELASQYNNLSGVATVISGDTSLFAVSNTATWSISTAGDGAGNALVKVTGDADTNITWHATVRIYKVGT